jgi:hypothetical protein
MEVSKKTWRSPVIEEVGNVADVVRNGVGKTVVLEGDSGEPNKNTQQDAG